MITEQDWSYFAGIIDGEGSIVLHKDKSNSRVWGEIQIYNTSDKLISWILDKFGGRFYVCSQTRKVPSFKKNSPCFTVRWNGQMSEGMLPRLLPYLIIKQEKALMLLALTQVSGYGTTNGNDKPRQLSIYKEFKEMARDKTGKELGKEG